MKNFSTPLNHKQTEDDDCALVAEICTNNQAAFGRLYERYVDKMLGLANLILGNSSDAEEVIHDVFIEIWNKAKTYNSSKASVFGWISLRVRSRCLDRIRKGQVSNKYLEKQKNEPQFQSKMSTDTYTDHKLLKSALSALSKNQRLVIELNYFKGYTCAEISNYYDIPLGTVKTRLLSAMKKMQTLFLNVKGGAHE